MLSSENIVVSTAATPETDSQGCCPWGSTADQTLSANCDIIEAGSTMDVTEASVASTSGARTTSSSVDTPVELSYSVNIQGINQTPGDMNEAAQGSATAYVSANLQEGLGNSTAKCHRSPVLSDRDSATACSTLAIGSLIYIRVISSLISFLKNFKDREGGSGILLGRLGILSFSIVF